MKLRVVRNYNIKFCQPCRVSLWCTVTVIQRQSSCHSRLVAKIYLNGVQVVKFV
jgi:hypothetical protein